MILLNLLIIQLIIVFIVDLSGVMEHIKKRIWKWLKGEKPYKDFEFKPFTCSTCMGWWIGLIYIICTGHFTILFIGYVALLSFLAPTFSNLLQLIKDILDYILWKISQMFVL